MTTPTRRRRQVRISEAKRVLANFINHTDTQGSYLELAKEQDDAHKLLNYLVRLARQGRKP